MRHGTSLLRRSSIALVLGRLATAASTYATLLVISIVYGFTTRGYIDILLQAAAVVALLCALGGPVAMAHFGATRSLATRTVFAWALISGGLTVLVAIVIALSRASVGLSVFSWVSVCVPIATMAIGINAFAAIANLAVAHGRSTAIMKAQVGASTLYLAVAGAFIAGIGPSTEPALVTELGFTYLLGAGWLALAMRLSALRVVPPIVRLTRLLGYGMRSAFGVFGAAVVVRGDILLLSTLVSAAEVGQYTTALLLMQTTQLVPSALGGKILADLSAVENPGQRSRILEQYSRRLFAFGVVGVVALLIFVLVLNVVVLPGSQLLLLSILLAPGCLLWMLISVSSADLSSIDRPGSAGVCFALGVAVMFAFDLITVPLIGIAGAAVGSSLGYGVTAAGLAVLQGRARQYPR